MHHTDNCDIDNGDIGNRNIDNRSSPGLVLVAMCAGYFLVLLDVTVVNVALPAIGAGLGSDVTGLQWVVDGYTLALASLLLAGGSLGDLLGHRSMVLTGLLGFGGASLLCGLAPTTGTLIAARVAQGVGAALLLPGTLAVVSRTYSDPQGRARAIGLWAGVGSIALPTGPLLAGVVVQLVGWRWVFLPNLPVALLAAVVIWRRTTPQRATRIGRFDPAGTALGAVVLAALTVAAIEAGHAGLTGPVAGALVITVGALVGFVLVERRSRSPMLPLGLFRRPAFGAANGAAAVMNLGSLGLLFLLTLYLQAVQHRSALAAGLAVVPLFLPLAVLAPLAGRHIARRGPARPMLAGLLLAAVGVGLIATWPPDAPYSQLLPALLAWGIGLGLLTPAVVAAAVEAVPADRAGLAAGVNNAARQAGGAIGIAGYGAIAGSPATPALFVTGLHIAGLLTAGLFLLAALVTGRLIARP